MMCPTLMPTHAGLTQPCHRPPFSPQTDISPVVIAQMAQRHASEPRLSYQVADCRHMPEYADCSFGGALDKGAGASTCSPVITAQYTHIDRQGRRRAVPHKPPTYPSCSSLPLPHPPHVPKDSPTAGSRWPPTSSAACCCCCCSYSSCARKLLLLLLWLLLADHAVMCCLCPHPARLCRHAGCAALLQTGH